MERFAGAIRSLSLTLHRHFEVDLSLLLVLDAAAPLLLLGNDLFRDHAGFKFLGLVPPAGAGVPTVVRLLDKNRGATFDIPCIEEPAPTHGCGPYRPEGI